MWNYIFYLGYLTDKDENDYTGTETYIVKKLKNLDYTWFPLHRFKIKY